MGIFLSPGVMPMSGFQGDDPLGGRNVCVSVLRAQQEVKTVKTVMAVEAPSTFDRLVTAKQPPKDRQKTAESSERPCSTRFCSCPSLWCFRVQDGDNMQRRWCIYAEFPARPRDFEDRQNHSGAGEARSTCATHLTPQLEMAHED